jgi:hypothetical protein
MTLFHPENEDSGGMEEER